MRRTVFGLIIVLFLLFTRPSYAVFDNIAGGDHEGQDWVISAGTTIAGVHTNVRDFIINTNITVNIKAFDGTNYGKVSIAARNIDIRGTLNGQGMGYSNLFPGSGNGANACVSLQSGAGGSHGGKAANSSNANASNPYGNFVTPITMGSAGGKGDTACNAGGSGGGAVYLTATDTINITGTITVAGSNPGVRAGGGSGGSVYFSAPNIIGNGTININGSNGNNGSTGGSGGRAAFHYTVSNPATYTIDWGGGNGAEQATVVWIDDTNNDLYVKTPQTWRADPSLEGSTHTYRNIYINANVHLIAYYTNNSDGVGFTFNVDNLTVANGIYLESTGGGYAWPLPGVGVGGSACGASQVATGGSHGNQAVATANATAPLPYGSFTAPVALGSAGGKGDTGCNPGGAGGGAIKIVASNTITNLGYIRAEGNNTGYARSGGGAGGSIYFVAKDFSGTGSLSVAGGSGNGGSTGGASGRIALHYSGINSSTWTIDNGGSAYGTAVWIDDTNNDIYLKNNQTWWANPTLEGSTHNYRNFFQYANLRLLSYYTTNSDGVGFTFNVTNFYQSNSIYLEANGAGYAWPLPGIGVGGSACVAGQVATGGSHGNVAAATANATAPQPYGNFNTPTTLGSAGGKGDAACNPGGAGGGAIKIVASDTISAYGYVQAEGYNTSYARSGAGSGGSIYFIARDFAGTAVFSVGGGSGSNGSTGGSGGRVALHYTGTNNSSWTVGNGGSSNGTVIWVNDSTNDLFIKNHQTWYANPSLEGSIHNYRNVTILPNINLRLQGYYTNNTDGVGHVFNVSNFNIQLNANLDLDGAGYQGTYSSGLGQGPGTLSVACTGDILGAGAGHGGAAANSANATGGGTYGSNLAPVLLGSSGTSGSSGSGCTLGGAGGGALKIRASQTITNNGIIYARGYYGGFRAGSGSGGSVYLIGNSYNGSGQVHVTGYNGRDGSTAGGGGRLALYYANSTNLVLPAMYWSGGAGAGVGTTIVTGFPAAPSSLVQYESNGSTVLPNGEKTSHSTVVAKFTVSAGTNMTLNPEVEVRPQGVGFSNVATHTGASLNYSGTPQTASVTVNGLSDLTQYHWQARVCDTSNNCSDWVTYDSNNNFDFRIVLDILPPTSNASSLQLTSPSLTNGQWTASIPTLRWTTASDDPSGSGIAGYCLSLVETAVGVTPPVIDPCSDDGILPGTAPYMVGTTSVNLSSISNLTLTNNKRYWVSIKAVDNVGNIFLGASNGSDYANLISFKYDTTPPTNVTSISAVSGSFSSINDFYFNWPTSGNLSSSDSESLVLGYQYAIGDTATWIGTTTSPELGISYIPKDVDQPFFLSSDRDSEHISVGVNTIYFRTVDNAGNYSSSASYRTAMISYGGNAPSFPNNSVVTVQLKDTTSSRPNNLFKISWPAATAYQGNNVHKYYYMVNTQPPANYNTIKSNSALYIGTTATEIDNIELPSVHRGSNTIYVAVVDDNKDAQNQLSPNYSPSNAITATFDFNSDLPDPPKTVVVADASVKEASLWRASLAWEQPDYAGTGNLTFTIQRSTDGTTWTTTGTTSGFAYLDTVPRSQKYYWRIGASDGSDDSIANPSYANAVTTTPKGTYTSASDLSSGPSVSSITTKKAKISWSTSRTSDSKVAYGTESGKYFDEEPSNSLQVTDHVINLVNLTPNTTYYYQSKWTDEDGNTGTSVEKSFTTSPAPSVSLIEESNVSISSALITFTVKNASKAKLLYGKTSSYGGLSTVNTSTEESTYSIKLDELADGTLYNYKLQLEDSEGFVYDFENHQFTTLPRPKITQVKIQQVPGTAQSTLLITWQTNTEVTSIVSYSPLSDSVQSRDEVDVKLAKGEHKMLIKGLSPNTPYSLIVRGRDKVGNEALSDRYNFTTATDTRPPSIYDISIDGVNVPAVNNAGQVSSSQLIVSWTTDEPSTSQVEFGEGSGSNYQQKTQEDENLTINHLVIISNLTPSKVYHLKALSKDKAGNVGNSIDTVTITPKATNNALDLVVTNLSQAFSFLNKIK